MRRVGGRPSGRAAFVTAWCAAVVGLVHSAFSLLWAAGGTWLLDTVGTAAPEMVTASGIPQNVALLVVGLLKAAAAVVPVVVVSRRLPWPRVWRTLYWTGGIVLALYGFVNAVVAMAVLAGVIDPDGGYNAAAMVGHAFVWGPMFAAWGALLVAAMWSSRGPAPVAEPSRQSARVS